MITEDYVSFEVAKLLKEKGFNEDCRAFRSPSRKLFYSSHSIKNFEDRKTIGGAIAAPTLQMAIKWLREIHHIIFVFKPSYFSGDECTYWTYERWCGDNFDGEVLSFKTYEEAVDAALKDSLENLI